MVPRTVLTRSGLISLNTVLTRSGLISLNTTRPVNIVKPRTTVNNTGPMKNVINNTYSTTRRPFNKITIANNSNFTKKVNIIKRNKVNTARPKAVISAVKGNKGNAVKASACWVWRPKHKVLDHGNPQQDLKDKGVIDSGCSRHMTGNRSYLTDYEEIDGGFVAFGGNSKGGKITGKGKIRTGKLDFEDAYFVKELKFNLLIVSQMCDKKNSVLFTDTECVVLSLDFKLTDEKSCKFAGKADEGFFVENSTNSKAFRVFNSRTRIVEENLHVRFIVTGNQSNGNASTKACDDADPRNEDSEVPSIEEPRVNQEKDDNVSSTNNVNTASDGNNTNNVNDVSSTVNAADIEVNAVDPKSSIELPDDPNIPELEDIVYSDDVDVGAEADMNNLDAFMPVSPIPTTRIQKDHPIEQIIRDLKSAPQTRKMTKNMTERAMFSSVQQRTNHKDFQNCMFACFLSQEEPKKIIQALKDLTWIEAMQEELL
ncbi:putative ribonuclease H-like domain-containing protein [Tanacetum coccineum]